MGDGGNVQLWSGVFLFNHRLTFAATYFIKDTRNMLLAPPSLGTIGSAAIPDQNVGQMRNQGLELELGYRKTTGDFTWHVGANATFIRNEVTRLATAGGFLAGPLYGRGTQEVTRTYQGHPYGTFYGYRTNGLYQTQAQVDSDPNIAKDTRRDQGQIRPGMSGLWISTAMASSTTKTGRSSAVRSPKSPTASMPG